MEDTLTYYGGGALKAVDDSGTVIGPMVTFYDGSHKDLVGDYFKKTTYLGARDGDGVDVLFHHGKPLAKGLESLSQHLFAPVKSTRDELQVWGKHVLDMADGYERMVFDLVKSGKLGWSTGAVPHQVIRESDGELKRWLVGETSYTPVPCEPYNRVLPMKSFDEEGLLKAIYDLSTIQMISDYKIEIKAAPVAPEVKAEEKPAVKVDDDPKETVATKSMKGIFEAELAEQSPTFWQLTDILRDVARDVASAAGTSDITGVVIDVNAKVTEAVMEFANRIIPVITGQINDFVEKDDENYFYLKSQPTGTVFNSLMDDSGNPRTGLRMQEHSETVLTAARELGANATATVKAATALAQRFDGKQDLDIKAGRVFSATNRERIKKHADEIAAAKDQLGTVASSLMDLYDKTDPMPKETPKSVESDDLNRLAAEWTNQQILYASTV
jgi:hypothetical protein